VTLPAPVPGLVIRYAFLWSTEQAAGKSEAAKERPCVLVVALKRADGGISTVVAPITHRPPEDPEDSIEVPMPVCRSLGLVGDRHWIRVDELNSFGWPGFDIRPEPRTGRVDYGMIPRALYEQVRRRILERNEFKKVRRVPRDA
jgi:hypothetical protein